MRLHLKPASVKTMALSCALSLIQNGFPAYALLPTSPSVIHGSAAFDYQDHGLTVTTSDKAIINYDAFSIGEGYRVDFHQPSASSVVLNRVTGVSPSAIFGMLTANGNVLLINPNGIVFGPNAQVNVNSFLASTLQIRDEDFLSGGPATLAAAERRGIIQNEGAITVAQGGRVQLIGGQVINQGRINAPGGIVGLVSGEEVILRQGLGGVQVAASVGSAGRQGPVSVAAGAIHFDGSSIYEAIAVPAQQVSLEWKDGQLVAGSPPAAIVENSGSIDAAGGDIALAGPSVLNSGLIRADGIAGGSLALLSTGKTANTGRVSLSGQTAGALEVLGKTIEMPGAVSMSGASGAGSFARITRTDDSLLRLGWRSPGLRIQDSVDLGQARLTELDLADVTGGVPLTITAAGIELADQSWDASGIASLNLEATADFGISMNNVTSKTQSMTLKATNIHLDNSSFEFTGQFNVNASNRAEAANSIWQTSGGAIRFEGQNGAKANEILLLDNPSFGGASSLVARGGKVVALNAANSGIMSLGLPVTIQADDYAAVFSNAAATEEMADVSTLGGLSRTITVTNGPALYNQIGDLKYHDNDENKDVAQIPRGSGGGILFGLNSRPGQAFAPVNIEYECSTDFHCNTGTDPNLAAKYVSRNNDLTSLNADILSRFGVDPHFTLDAVPTIMTNNPYNAIARPVTNFTGDGHLINRHVFYDITEEVYGDPDGPATPVIGTIDTIDNSAVMITACDFSGCRALSLAESIAVWFDLGPFNPSGGPPSNLGTSNADVAALALAAGIPYGPDFEVSYELLTPHFSLASAAQIVRRDPPPALSAPSIGFPPPLTPVTPPVVKDQRQNVDTALQDPNSADLLGPRPPVDGPVEGVQDLLERQAQMQALALAEREASLQLAREEQEQKAAAYSRALREKYGLPEDTSNADLILAIRSGMVQARASGEKAPGLMGQLGGTILETFGDLGQTMTNVAGAAAATVGMVVTAAPPVQLLMQAMGADPDVMMREFADQNASNLLDNAISNKWGEFLFGEEYREMVRSQTNELSNIQNVDRAMEAMGQGELGGILKGGVGYVNTIGPMLLLATPAIEGVMSLATGHAAATAAINTTLAAAVGFFSFEASNEFTDSAFDLNDVLSDPNATHEQRNAAIARTTEGFLNFLLTVAATGEIVDSARTARAKQSELSHQGSESSPLREETPSSGPTRQQGSEDNGLFYRDSDGNVTFVKNDSAAGSALDGLPPERPNIGGEAPKPKSEIFDPNGELSGHNKAPLADDLEGSTQIRKPLDDFGNSPTEQIHRPLNDADRGPTQSQTRTSADSEPAPQNTAVIPDDFPSSKPFEPKVSFEDSMRRFENGQALDRLGKKVNEASLEAARSLLATLEEAGMKPAMPELKPVFAEVNTNLPMPDSGIKLHIGDAPKGGTAAEIAQGREDILNAFVAAVQEVEAAGGPKIKFKVTVGMDAAGVQEGKFITVYTDDPAAAMALAQKLDGELGKLSMNGATPPAGDIPLGDSGLLAWRYGGYKQVTAPDASGKLIKVEDTMRLPDGQLAPDLRNDPLANLEHAKDQPGMDSWLQAARQAQAAGSVAAPAAPAASGNAH